MAHPQSIILDHAAGRLAAHFGHRVEHVVLTAIRRMRDSGDDEGLALWLELYDRVACETPAAHVH